jgi:hypothetical protein
MHSACEVSVFKIPMTSARQKALNPGLTEYEHKEQFLNSEPSSRFVKEI